MPSSHLPTQIPPDAFSTDAASAFAAFRAALTRVIAALPGDNLRPTDLQNNTDLDYKLCWQLFQVYLGASREHSRPLDAAQHVPSAVRIKRFLTKAARKGVDPKLIALTQSSATRLHHVIETHAGDRAAFGAMAASLTSDTTASEDAITPKGRIELEHRRAAYRALSHIWGLEVDTHLLTAIVRPSPTGNGTDECTLSKKLGLRRLRPDVPAPVYGLRHHASSPTPSPIAGERQPLDPAAYAQYGAPLLPEFCTQPLPHFTTETYENGWTYSHIAGDAIGRQSAVDLTFASISHAVPYSTHARGQRWFRLSSRFSTPTGLHIADVLLHRPSFGILRRSDTAFLVFKHTPGDDSLEIAGRAQRLPIHVDVEHLGPLELSSKGSPIRLKEVPDYPEILQSTFARLTWDPAEFDTYRIRLHFPVMGSLARLQFPLP